MFDSILDEAANASVFDRQMRHRSTPLIGSLTPIAGFPRKLGVYKIQASRFWQVRCWVNGRFVKRSTRSENIQVAKHYARQFFAEVMTESPHQSGIPRQPQYMLLHGRSHGIEPPNRTLSIGTASERARATPASQSFAFFASQLCVNEAARVQRGDLAHGSLQILHNRLDRWILPRWGGLPATEVDHQQLMAFVNELSREHSSTTVSQYLIIVRKVLSLAMSLGHLDALPAFPKVKNQTQSRGGFTPSEYWRLLRTSREMEGLMPDQHATELRKQFGIRSSERELPKDLTWVIRFMVNSFIRPGDLKFLRHKHIEVIRSQQTYLRLTLPPTKKHDKPIVTLAPAVHVYEALCRRQSPLGAANSDDYVFLPHLKDREYAHRVLAFHFNQVLSQAKLKAGPAGQARSLYSLRHSSITFRLLYGSGIDLLTLARNARTSVDMISKHYASTVTAEQNIGLLQSRRTH